MIKRPSVTQSRHDRLFKKVFSNPENAASELACVLPPEMLDLLDLSTLKQASSEFVSPGLEANPADLFFSAKMRGMDDQDALICVLLEHYSQIPRFWQVRVLYYNAHGWMKFRSEHPEAKYLPVIIPVVVYNGKWTYGGELSFSSLFHPEAVKTYKSVIPDFTPVMENLRDVSSESLRARSMEAEAKLGLWFLQHGYAGQQLYDQLPRWEVVLEQLCESGNWRDALESFLRYYLYTPNGPGYAPFLNRMEEVVGEKGKETMMTIAEQLKSEGKAQAVLTVLKARGVEWSVSERERILSCRDLPTLEEWVRRAANASKVSEVLGTN